MNATSRPASPPPPPVSPFLVPPSHIASLCTIYNLRCSQAKLSGKFSTVKSDVVVNSVVAHSAGPHFAHSLVQVRCVPFPPM